MKVELRRLGVVFEGNDLPDLITVNGMAEVLAAMPITVARVNVARGFGDSEGHLLALGNLFCQKDLTKIKELSLS